MEVQAIGFIHFFSRVSCVQKVMMRLPCCHRFDRCGADRMRSVMRRKEWWKSGDRDKEIHIIEVKSHTVIEL